MSNCFSVSEDGLSGGLASSEYYDEDDEELYDDELYSYDDSYYSENLSSTPTEGDQTGKNSLF